MGKLKVTLILNNSNPVFYPGQFVTGKVIVECKDDCKISAINLNFSGSAHVRWSERHGSGKSRRTVTYSSNEIYCNTIQKLLMPDHGEKEIKLKEGQTYDYQFSQQIPLHAPSSYEARIGNVRYIIQAHVDIPWAFDSYAKQAITVVNLLDLNSLPNLTVGAELTNSKTLCCLCCESDPISATMRVVDRTGFVPGESITFSADIENKSSRTMNASIASLIMNVKYITARKTKVVNNVLYKVNHGKIEEGGSDVWRGEKLYIPPVPPSYLQGCNIIDIRYYANMAVDPAGPGFDLNVPIEVVIGSIPLRHIAEQHGLTLPSAPSAPPAQPTGFQPITAQPLAGQPVAGQPLAGAPSNIYGDLSMPASLPQATFAESAFGRVSTKEDGDKGDNHGQTEYAPMYTYYNWDRNPSNNFTVKEAVDPDE